MGVTFVICFVMCACVQVKPLGVIWGKYGEFYNRKNTIMFDDIGRNFLMNPQNGLKVDGQRPLSSHLSSSQMPSACEARLTVFVCTRSGPS